ncbi:MAG: response regulator, partial [Anaerolineales bacterium]|nr:response regulator [Anaerolineales bacterium]
TGKMVMNTFSVVIEEEDRHMEYMLNPVEDDESNVISVVCTMMDVTEQKLAQEVLWHSQKMESLGVLAGGVAHDFNNLLVAILSQTSLALLKLPADVPAGAHIEKARKAAERAADLTKQLLAYSGKGRFALQPIQLNQFIQDNLHFFEVAISKHIRLQLDLADMLPTMEGDPGQMQQIVMNLLLNASEAIGDQPGVIKVMTRLKEVTAVDEIYWQLTKHPLPPGPYILLHIQDSGSGMDEKTIQKIFDPFFTTKFTGRGLGLAAVLGIVRGHKGGLRVASRIGNGTTFELLFPVAETDDFLSVQEQQIEAEKMKGTILIIDDEQHVRDAITDILQEVGVQVLTAANGQQGIDLYRQKADEIDLILLDLSMPGLSWQQTFQTLKHIKPTAKIILSSGYSEADVHQNFSEEGITDFLPKPYDTATLTQTIRHYL